MRDNKTNNENPMKVKFTKDNSDSENERDFKNQKSQKGKISNQKFNNDKYNKSKKRNTKQDRENDNIQKLKNYDEELIHLKTRISKETPPSGYYYFNKDDFNFDSDSEDSQENNEKDKLELNQDDEEIKPKTLWKKEKFYFKDLAVSRKTLKGLSESKFVKMTPIQRYTLPHSLSGKDILGSSKTGSGKTLCFIIPVIECLYRQKWSNLDGLGALLILPTRELAMQVFEVFRMVGKYHDFSIGLVIGGNNLQQEQERLYKINILIGTPGRLSQHFSETPYLTTDNVQILVIDEADRILDDGFETSINEIISYMPTKNRQTLLYSATLTKSIKRLAKVSLKSPEYISVNNVDAFLSVEKAEEMKENDNGENTKNKNVKLDQINLKLNSNQEQISNENNKLDKLSSSQKFNNDLTPINLNQFYTTCETHEKIDILFSFLKTHKSAKCLVFLSSCKQVRYYTEIFKRLKLGMTFLDLHGKQKQGKRTNIFYTYLNKKNTVLFATDIASRGVDFPAVDWVIQLDCPEDISTYIHRVGRTARYKSKGNSLLFVNKKEEKIVDYLQNKNIKIKKIKINTSKLVGLQPILRSLISENSELIHLAQKAIKSYLKSIYLQSNKDIFDIKTIDIQKLALSYGLVNLPELKITKKSENEMKNLKKSIMNAEEEDDSEYDRSVDENDDTENQNKLNEEPQRKKSKLQKLKEKISIKKQQKNQELNDILTNNPNKENLKKEQDKIKPEEFLKLKRKNENKNVKNIEEEQEKKAEVLNNQIISVKSENKKNDFYEKLKAKLVLNEDEDKIKEKSRISDKHRADRLKNKQFDYEKHGLNSDGENDEEDEEFDDEQKLQREEELLLQEAEKKISEKTKKKKGDNFEDSDGETYNFKFSEDKKLKNKDKGRSIVRKGKNYFFLYFR